VSGIATRISRLSRGVMGHGFTVGGIADLDECRGLSKKYSITGKRLFSWWCNSCSERKWWNACIEEVWWGSIMGSKLRRSSIHGYPNGTNTVVVHSLPCTAQSDRRRLTNTGIVSNGQSTTLLSPPPPKDTLSPKLAHSSPSGSIGKYTAIVLTPGSSMG